MEPEGEGFAAHVTFFEPGEHHVQRNRAARTPGSSRSPRPAANFGLTEEQIEAMLAYLATLE